MLRLPPRTPWRPGFPDVVLHASLAERDAHPAYVAAKSGDAEAALRLASELLKPEAIAELNRVLEGRPAILLPITALETSGFNAIPDAMAQTLGRTLGLKVSAGEIVQDNKVGHTRARAYNRLVTPASFEGVVEAGEADVLVDDHVGLGGTLANLKGFLETSGAVVVAMTTLTESRDARRIALTPDTLAMLRNTHGEDLETLWRDQFGHGLDCLTELEGWVLSREPSVDAIRDRLAQGAIEARRRGLDPTGPFAP